MRACHVVYSYYPFDPRVRKEAEALVSAGHEVYVIAAREDGQSHQEQIQGVRVHRVPIPLVRGGKTRYLYQYVLFLLTSTVLLSGMHLRRRFRVVHVHSLPDFQVFAALLAKVTGARVVLDLHEAMPEILAARFRLTMTSPWVRLARALEWLSCAFADRVIVVDSIRARLVAGRGVDSRKTAIVMNSPTKLPESLPPTDDLRARFHLDGRWVLVQAGGINAERDLETLVRAASMLNETHPTSLLLFGKGDEAFRLRLAMLAEREAGRLDFRLEDWIPPGEAFRHVCLSDVGVATYERNPLTEYAAPHKVFEYVAAGKPLVLANLRALRTTWEDAAVFYEPGDPVDLARQIRRVLEDKALSASLRLRAAQVLEACDWRHSRTTLVSLYAGLG